MINLKTENINYIGNGEVKILKNKNIFLKDSKGYLIKNGESEGAYWINKIVDENGNILKLISNNKNNSECYKPTELLNKSYLEKLQQSKKDCIYIQK